MEDSSMNGDIDTVTNEAWARRIVLTLLATWLVSAFVALVSFRILWAQWPPLWDALLGLTLLAPLALPMSLVQTLGGRNVWRGVQMLLFVIAYWALLTGLLVFAYRRRSRLALVLFFAVSVVAAFRWLYSAGGMLGI